MEVVERLGHRAFSRGRSRPLLLVVCLSDCREIGVPAGAVVHVEDLRRTIVLGVTEVAEVRLAIHRWLVGLLHFQGLEGWPIEVHVPVVVLDICSTTIEHGQAQARILLHEAFDQRLRSTTTLRREGHLRDPLLYLGIGLHHASGLERRTPCHELEDEHAQRPPVYRKGATRGSDHLRGHVVRRTADCVGLARDHLGQSHVH
mmetsp:Transcript_90853/g.194832  ORF Transcript_90853/g.194832 Transcript_90853/m.194832 type:complete len:202 (-) Transcript_90853:657-1262(-)